MEMYYSLVINNDWSDNGFVVSIGSKEQIYDLFYKHISGDLTEVEKRFAKINGYRIHILEYEDGIRKSRTTTSMQHLDWFKQHIVDPVININ